MTMKILIVCLLSIVVYAQNPISQKFPSSIVTDQDLGVAPYNATYNSLTGVVTTLTASVDAVVLSFSVVDNSIALYSVVTVDNERLMVCSKSTGVLTMCARGYGGSTASSHTIGAKIYSYVDPHSSNALRQAVKDIQTALGVNMAGLANFSIPHITLSNGSDDGYVKVCPVADSTHCVTLKSPASRSTDLVVRLPSSDPSGTQYLACGSPSSGVSTCSWSSSGGAWGSITGTLSNQTDLAAALGGKQPSLGTGTTSQYLRGDLAWTNFPSIPTITGSSVLKGSSGSAVAAAYTDVVGLFGSGSCSGYLKSDGTCGSSTPTGADPLGFYWVSRSTNAPANGVNLGSLSTGLLKITVASGVATPSTAVANTDYLPVNPTSLTVGDGTVTGQFQLYPAGDATHYFGLSASSSRGTALMLTAPSADPTAGSGSGQALACGAPSSNVSTCSWYTPATVTGSSVLKGSSGSAVAAAYADVVGLFGSGSCSGYLKSDGTCSTVTGGGVSNKYAAAISGTSTSISAATHGLGSTVVVSGCKDGSGAALWPDWSVDGSGNVTVTSAVAQSGTCYIFGQSIYAASISGTSTSVTAATHGLGTGVIVSGCKDGSNNSLAPDWTVDGSGNVTITSAVSQSGTCYLR